MRERLLALLRIGLGAVFVYAALSKVPSMGAFAEEIANYRLVPAPVIPLLGAALVGVELLAGLALATGIAARGAALLVSVLLAAFTAGLSQAIARGIDLECGCFGGREPATWLTVGRDLALLAAGLALVCLGPGRLRLRRAA
jgi:uncharacterized membrane protein YphA (DoxX/SURF4 family)